MSDQAQPVTKDTLMARINQAASEDDLDAVESIAVELGYKEDGILLRTLTERRGRFAKARRTRGKD